MNVNFFNTVKLGISFKKSIFSSIGFKMWIEDKRLTVKICKNQLIITDQPGFQLNDSSNLLISSKLGTSLAFSSTSL
jgi:hypothetical protein